MESISSFIPPEIFLESSCAAARRDEEDENPADGPDGLLLQPDRIKGIKIAEMVHMQRLWKCLSRFAGFMVPSLLSIATTGAEKGKARSYGLLHWSGFGPAVIV